MRKIWLIASGAIWGALAMFLALAVFSDYGLSAYRLRVSSQMYVTPQKFEIPPSGAVDYAGVCRQIALAMGWKSERIGNAGFVYPFALSGSAFDVAVSERWLRKPFVERVIVVILGPTNIELEAVHHDFLYQLGRVDDGIRLSKLLSACGVYTE